MAYILSGKENSTDEFLMTETEIFIQEKKMKRPPDILISTAFTNYDSLVIYLLNTVTN